MDFYILLGVERGATLNDIKRAYKRLARRYHPDINPGDRVAEAHFRQISEAYETLSDPDRRRRYDVQGVIDRSPADQPFGFEGFDFSARVSAADAPTFGDLFADVFQQRGRAGDRAERGVDIHHAIELAFEEALTGGQRTVTVTRQERCRTCRGSGRLAVAETRCVHCHGSGSMKSTRGHMVFSRPCAHCGGAGTVGQARCPSCGGQQVEMRAETLTINVPPGLADGARIRVPHKGHIGRNGGEAGDLYIDLHVASHPLFRREGDDIHVTVPVAIHEAALGARIDVPAPGGSTRVRIPPGTQAGQRFRLRDRGVPMRDGRRGDLVIEVQLALPRVLDERSKELLREFGRINAGDVREALSPQAHKGHQEQ